MALVLKHVLIAALCLSFGLGINCCRCRPADATFAHAPASMTHCQMAAKAKLGAWTHCGDCHCRERTIRTLCLRRLEIAAPTAAGPRFWTVVGIQAANEQKGCPRFLTHYLVHDGASANQSLLSLHCALRV